MLLPCRYVWLPLWVLDGDTILSKYENSPDATISTPPSSMSGLQVTVQWQALWRMSDLDALPKGLMPMRSTPVNVSLSIDDVK